MTEKLSYRPSSTDRVLRCPSSAQPTEHEFNPTSDAANLGRAVHQVLHAHGAGLTPDIEKTAEAHQLDADQTEELGMLYRFGAKMHDEHVAEWLTFDTRYEETLESDLFKGTPDIYDHSTKRGVIVDWKTGRVSRNYYGQLCAYAHLVRAKHGPSQEYICITAWVRSGDVEVSRITNEQLDEFEDMFRHALKKAGKEYNPGDVCGFCPRQLDCTARQAWIHDAGQALQTADAGQLTASKLAELYPQAKMLEEALKRYNQALRHCVEMQDTLQIDDKTELYFQTRTKAAISNLGMQQWGKVHGVLKEHDLSADEIAATMSMSKPKMMKALGAKGGKAAKESAEIALNDYITRTEYSALAKRKIKGGK